MLRTVLIAAALSLIAVPSRAEPQSDAVTLTYLPSRVVTAACPAADFLAIELHYRLGYELIQPSAPEHLTVKLDRAGKGFRSIGEIKNDDGNVLFEQTYSGIDCTEAVVGMAALVSFQYRKPREEKAPPVSEPPKVTLSPPVADPLPAPNPAPPETPRAPPPVPPRAQLAIAADVSLGVAPATVGGVSGAVGVRWKTRSVALEVGALVAPSATVEKYLPSTGFLYVVTNVASLACIHPNVFVVCGRAEVVMLSVANRDTRFTHERTFSVGVGPRLGVDLKLTQSVTFRAYSDLLLRPLVGLLRDNATRHELWSGSPASISLNLGPVFSFPMP